jgi:hypothetical protein
MKHNPVVHFEMPYSDGQRMSEFYHEVFNWQLENMGEKMGNYILATTAPADDKGHPKMPGTINGGFYPVSEDELSKCPGIVIAVENLAEATDKVKKAGGKVMADWEIPEVGHYASAVDPEGNRIGILQPNQM